MTQFLPSSYLSWAVDGDKNGAIDLNDLDDAIFSVANYLKTNGFGVGAPLNNGRQSFTTTTVRAYVDAVLTLAQRSRPRLDAPPR
ncbi:MAG: lytic murein transglycosylase [Ignavibacteria bacterium]|nr:lytic murein transglycosylase [Ignavibacteria bacterium]